MIRNYNVVQKICNTVCDVTTLVCLRYNPDKVTCALWGPACHISCKLVPECVNVPVCIKTIEICGPGF